MNAEQISHVLAIRNPFEIQLFCQEPSHDEKRWNICKLELFDHGDHSSWMPDWNRVQSVRRQLLDGDRRHPDVLTTTPGDGYEEKYIRGRYLFKCRRCNLSLPIREADSRWQDLERFLDKLASLGASEVPLSTILANI